MKRFCTKKIKEIVTEAVLGFLNEIKSDKPRKIFINGNHPRVPIKRKNSFVIHSPGLNEKQLREIKDIRKELEKELFVKHT